MASKKATAAEEPEASPETSPTVKRVAKKGAKKRRRRGAAKKAAATAPRVQVSADQLPRKTLEQSLRIARALREVHAGGPAQWPQIASAIGLSPGNQANKYFLWSAQAYGLIEKDDDAYSL